MFLRITSGILFFIAALLLPWWASGMLGMALLVIYKNFWEFPAAAFVMDVLFSAAVPHFFGFSFVGSTIALLLFLIRRFVSKQLFIKSRTV